MRQHPGTLLANRFRLRVPLARGGMGELWLAEHLGLGTEVVVKFISAQLSDRPGVAERFAREAAAAARVNSPHVVKVLDYGASADGAPFIVMERLEGRDLAAHLEERGSLPPDSVARIVRQLAKALTKAHAAHIIHRDIKPANVFVCATEGELFVKLLDFGVAKTAAADAQGATMSGMCVGTAGYMSPEQILASKQLDSRADLWSLGVLAFHCLTGRKPFDGETPGAVLLAIRMLALPKPSRYVPSLPLGVDTWFERACSWEPEQRFESAIEMTNALSSALAVSVEPLAPEAEEPSRVLVRADASPSMAGQATMPQPAPTLSAHTPATDDSLLQSSTTAAGPSRRSHLALPLAAVAAIALGGATYAGTRWHAPRDAQSSSATLGDAQIPSRGEVQLPRGDIGLPAPEVPTSKETANDVAVAAPEILQPVHRPDPARKPRPRAQPSAPAGSAEGVAKVPVLATSAATSATSQQPSPAPSATTNADTSRLYVMPDARR